MANKNTVFLLVGQRGAGKTEYGKRLMEADPGLRAISRDEILIRRYGSVHTDPYTSAGQYAYEIMERLLRRKLSTQTEARILLDCWTGDSKERKNLVKKLKQYGASRVVALYFVTPLEVVQKWFWQKPGIVKMSEIRTRSDTDEKLSFFSDNAPSNDHGLFHRWAANIDSNGFDKVIRINPQDELVALN